jgi:hypothetical protein
VHKKSNCQSVPVGLTSHSGCQGSLHSTGNDHAALASFDFVEMLFHSAQVAQQPVAALFLFNLLASIATHLRKEADALTSTCIEERTDVFWFISTNSCCLVFPT